MVKNLLINLIGTRTNVVNPSNFDKNAPLKICTLQMLLKDPNVIEIY